MIPLVPPPSEPHVYVRAYLPTAPHTVDRARPRPGAVKPHPVPQPASAEVRGKTLVTVRPVQKAPVENPTPSTLPS